jgi:hypothetical protein
MKQQQEWTLRKRIKGLLNYWFINWLEVFIETQPVIIFSDLDFCRFQTWHRCQCLSCSCYRAIDSSSVGIATGYRLYGLDSIPDKDKRFLSTPQLSDRL